MRSPTPVDHCSAFARSLSSIHMHHQQATRLSPVPVVGNAASSDEDLNHDSNNAIHTPQNNSRRRLGRQSSSPTSSAIAPPFSDNNLPALPFSKDESRQRQRRSRSENDDDHQQRRRSDSHQPAYPHDGFRKDYSLGETITSPSHMIIKSTDDRALQAANSLQKHDFAFVRRSDGSHSYAILAYRSFEPIKSKRAKNNATEECMTFVINDGGCTKMIRRKHWSEFVRLVSVVEESYKRPKTNVARMTRERSQVVPVVVSQEVDNDDRVGDLPPRVISFIPDHGDEYSLISSVSDRARGLC